MKKIAIIGSNGMLGSDLVKYVSPNFSVTPISKDNYSQHVHSKFDVVVNANGNSNRFWANKNPEEDFYASTASVYKSIFDFPCDIYIYISSPDVYENHQSPKYTKEDREINPQKLQPYGLHKYMSELIVKKYKEKFLILRHSMILGKNLKKGPLYDIIHDKPIFVTLATRLQLITTRAIAEVIETLLEKSVTSNIINVGGTGTFDFEKIPKYFDKEIRVSSNAEKQTYEMNVEKIKRIYPKIKTSEEYLREFLKEYSY